MKLPRRNFLHLVAGAAALPAVSRVAQAQSYPARLVTIIVGQAAVASSQAASTFVSCSAPQCGH
jgi:hypothetical protein